MKLHGYLEQMVGDKVSVSVLRALIRYKGKIFTIRGLARDAGAPHPKVSETVGELERLGHSESTANRQIPPGVAE